MAAISSMMLGQPVSQRRTAVQTDDTWHRATWHTLLALLTVATLLIHGYHPFTEDGGLYAAGVEHLIDPTLFPHFTAFVTAHLHYSAFAYVLAGIIRLTHISLAWLLFATYVVTLWLTLLAALRILQRCSLHALPQLAGVALLSAWATLPVAGTSLVLIDPYLTARSISTPLSLFAIAFALDTWFNRASQSHRRPTRSFWLCFTCLTLAAAVHPLMAAYAFAMVIALRIFRSAHWRLLTALLLVVTLLLAAALHIAAPSESPAVIQTSISRYYWFLSQWQWYELCGLAGPLIILGFLCRSSRNHANPSMKRLCAACLFTGTTAILVALLFAHQNASTHLIARLQPLRVFLLIYALMAVLLAATLAQRLAERLTLPVCASLFCLIYALNAWALFSAQRSIYPASQHLELPSRAPTNPWSQAFLWAHDNTPKDTLFALDADYITQPGEDAHTFRSIAQRSAVPDFSKDGGEASITPWLATLWQQGVVAQKSLSQLDDTTRDARLLPLGVKWMVLRNSAVTQHPCSYRNGIVKVCRLAP